MKEVLLIIDIGTLDKIAPEPEDIAAIKNFQGKKLILTGWDFRGQGSKHANKYDADAIVCESSILYIRPEAGWEKGKAEANDLHTLEDIKVVKQANYKLTSKILEYRNPIDIMFFSQANEKGVCYYINPRRKDKEEKFQEFITKQDLTLEEFRKRLNEVSHNSIVKEAIEITDGAIKLPDSGDNRYYVEKTNALYRTFRPYQLKTEVNQLFVRLLPWEAEQSFEFQYSDLDKIVNDLWAEGAGELSVKEYFRIAPQLDICIDIFPRTKKQTWRQAVEMSGLSECHKIFYICRETESDIPFIVDGYRHEYFYALATRTMPSTLKSAGVIPKANSVTEALNFVGSH